MANHQELADFIKNVHVELRLRSREIGPSAAWEEHCSNKEKLQEYARAMEKLASTYWEKNNGQSSELSRIFWVMKEIEWYYNGGGKSVFLEKERRFAEKYSIEYSVGSGEAVGKNSAIRLLDVGSCYNPFASFPNLEVTAIDLSPAHEGVFECDFLSVRLGDSLIAVEGQCEQLPLEHYDVVVFSLLLEYLPSPEQRFRSCIKALSLLKPAAILVILTPDSKHSTANSKLLRDWRLALASIGFLLVKSEKLKHIRCITFGKATDIRAARKWLSFQEAAIPPELAMAIPQDRNPYDSHTTNQQDGQVRTELDNKFVAESFSCLIAEDDLFV